MLLFLLLFGTPSGARDLAAALTRGAVAPPPAKPVGPPGLRPSPASRPPIVRGSAAGKHFRFRSALKPAVVAAPVAAPAK